MYLLELSFCLDTCPGVGLLLINHGNSIFSLLRKLHVFSMVAGTVYIPSSREGGLPFLHALSSICDL